MSELLHPHPLNDAHLLYISDGYISYDELLSYFQSANSQLRERFTHLFAEHTFIGTPVCEHCKGMVMEAR